MRLRRGREGRTHPKFGAGTIVRIESITTDHKIVVDFGSYGEKTLLARFAKLRKL